MFQVQTNDYKAEIERLTTDIADLKKKYFEQKRREQVQK